MAAEQGNVRGQYALAMTYMLHIDGMTQNYPEAAKWFAKAAEQGETDAQPRLGELYEYGRGVEQNLIEAYVLYSLSAENENQQAQESLAEIGKKCARRNARPPRRN